MKITYKQNRYTHNVNVALNKVGEVLNLLQSLNYKIILVKDTSC